MLPKVSNSETEHLFISSFRGLGGTRCSSGFSACQLFAFGYCDIGDWSQQMSSPFLHLNNAVTLLQLVVSQLQIVFLAF